MKPIKNRKRNLYPTLKRIFDISASLIGLIILSPLFILFLFLVWISLGRPVFYTQERPGLNASPFRIIKFRTMNQACDSQGKLMADQLRTTKMGRLLRKASIDELPELLNVLKGEMSFVGPRPLLVRYLPFYTERERVRHSVRPGITGLAQVAGRNLLMWDERLEMDVQYVENLSLWLDIKILFQTAINVIIQRNTLSVSSEFIPDFDDYRQEQLRGKSNES